MGCSLHGHVVTSAQKGCKWHFGQSSFFCINWVSAVKIHCLEKYYTWILFLSRVIPNFRNFFYRKQVQRKKVVRSVQKGCKCTYNLFELTKNFNAKRLLAKIQLKISLTCFYFVFLIDLLCTILVTPDSLGI